MKKLSVYGLALLLLVVSVNSFIVAEFVEAQAIEDVKDGREAHKVASVKKDNLQSYNTVYFTNATHFILNWDSRLTGNSLPRQLAWSTTPYSIARGREIPLNELDDCAQYSIESENRGQEQIKYANRVSNWLGRKECQDLKNEIDYYVIEFQSEGVNHSLIAGDYKVVAGEITFDFSDLNATGFSTWEQDGKVFIGNVKGVDTLVLDPLITPSAQAQATEYSFQNHIFYAENSDMWFTCWFNSTTDPEIGCANSSNGEDWDVFQFNPDPPTTSHGVTANTFTMMGENINGVDVIYLHSDGYFSTDGCWIDRAVVHSNGTFEVTNSSFSDCGTSAANNIRMLYVTKDGQVVMGRQDGNGNNFNNLTNKDEGNNFVEAFNADVTSNLFNAIGGNTFYPKIIQLGEGTCDMAIFYTGNAPPTVVSKNYSCSDGTFTANSLIQDLGTGQLRTEVDVVRADLGSGVNLTFAYQGSLGNSNTDGIWWGWSDGNPSTAANTEIRISDADHHRNRGGIGLSVNESTGRVYLFYVVNQSDGTANTQIAWRYKNHSEGQWSEETNLTNTATVKNALTVPEYTGWKDIVVAWTEGPADSSTFNVTTANLTLFTEEEASPQPVQQANVSIVYPTAGLEISGTATVNHTVNWTINATQDLTYTGYLYLNGSFNHTSTANSTLNLSVGSYQLNVSVYNGSHWSSNDTVQYTISEVAANSCTYTSGDWIVDCSDNCLITSNVDVGGNDIEITGTGFFTVDNANISNFADVTVRGTSSSNICEVTLKNGGGFT